MAKFASCADVLAAMAANEEKQFPPAEVWIANFRAPNPFPTKFTYQACTAWIAGGGTCGKSIEHGRTCRHHSAPTKPAFRFQVVVFDCHNVLREPLIVNLWGAAGLFLECAPWAFSCAPPEIQLDYVRAVVDATPKVQMYLRTKDGVASAYFISTCLRSRVPLPIEMIVADCRSTRDDGIPSPSTAGETSGKTKTTLDRSSDAAVVVRGLAQLFDCVDIGPRIQEEQE